MFLIQKKHKNLENVKSYMLYVEHNLIKIRSTHLLPIFYRFFGRSCVDLTTLR
jgi:hypothetical protein